MNISEIQAAAKAKTEVQIMIPDVGMVRGVPRISWQKTYRHVHTSEWL